MFLRCKLFFLYNFNITKSEFYSIFSATDNSLEVRAKVWRVFKCIEGPLASASVTIEWDFMARSHVSLQHEGLAGVSSLTFDFLWLSSRSCAAQVPGRKQESFMVTIAKMREEIGQIMKGSIDEKNITVLLSN